ncbi:copper chaperone PCu(A)C [Parashewanella spongiae]|uniref:Copper chaperone PCu(A)C n=1 Tax=Parashewanella spongiae TaxID=342950 RepID=A0A3A6U994_9GAMM|nr:copper chaperone PCu(A)C [Parashewanella spongiae]MCL1076693.1 copper chaperone PCu(A)C [Parashewanella spongiae]RJY18501.1 copper chaperone PCu(A)C [Parashewanella spongiae]
MRMISTIFVALVSVFSSSTFATDVKIDDAWIRAMPPTSRVVPIYLTMENTGSKTVSLTAISSPRGYVEIHQTLMKDGMMRMQQVDKVDISAGGKSKLEPAGFHGMLMNFTDGVPAKGESVPLTLTLSNGDKVSITATVKMSADTEDHSHHH